VFSQDVSGSIADTQTDIDGDGGTTASIGQLGGTSTLGGAITAQTVTELATLPVANTDCLPTEVQFPFVHASAVERITSVGALIYLAMDPVTGGFSCVDPATGSISGRVSLFVIGGTGPAAGATGTATFTFSGDTVALDSMGGAVHTSLSGTVAGTIVLP